MPRAVIIGAGSVGRGFLGQVLCEAGWSVTFLDVDADLVRALSEAGSYPHLTVSHSTVVRSIVGPVTAINVRDREAAVAALADADLAATSVGLRALPAVADTLAPALQVRIASGRPGLNVLLAENVHECAAVMRRLLSDRLLDLDAGALSEAVGLVETSIGRMIPADLPPGVAEPGLVVAEPYRLLPYDAAAVVGPPLQIPGLVADPGVPFAFYGDRKLYIHNLGHCFTAQLGQLLGDGLVSDTSARLGVRYLVRAAMAEAALAVAVRHNVPVGPLLDHVDDLVHRFGNRALGDTNERVARDPQRKLAPGDRLLGPLRLAAERELPSRHLSLAVATGAVSLAHHEGWSRQSVWLLLAEELGSVLEPDQWTLLSAQADALSSGLDVTTQLALIDACHQPATVA